MQTKVQKWGNSLALRIPKSFAAEVGISDNAVVDLALVDGRLVVTPAADTHFTLARLLAGITPENLHGEVDTGSPTGNEAW